MSSQQNFADAAIEDKNVMEYHVAEKNDDLSQVLNKLKKEHLDNQNLVKQVKSQEIEIKTLLNCVDSLRKQVVEYQKGGLDGKSILDKYGKYNEMMDIYQDSEKMIAKIKQDRTVEVQKDVFDLAMKKITTQAEIEMLDIELKQLIEEFSEDINLNEIGLAINIEG